MEAGFPFGSGGEQQQPPLKEAFFLYGGGGPSRSDDMDGCVYTRGFELTWQQQQRRRYSGFPHQLPLAGSAAIGGGGGQSCQDCGNQAKKECAHLRCRICCINRSFKCSTHIKSTWVPAARRRERQQHQAAGSKNSKRFREIVPSTTAAATTAVTTTFGATLDSGIFPPELNTEAMFRCVRVSAVDDADEEYAYQTTVRIAGHLFKGILYDHGAASNLPSSQLAREASTSSATPAATSTPELLDGYSTPLTAIVADASLPFFPQQQRPS
ncbi:protein SHORT INTERNODES-like [Zingiber officinale]|nr:protein SHORT INTERNODES-like [Zingiber officinale]